MSVTEAIDVPSNGISSIPIKTMWFEYLLQPKLLETHLQSDNIDPSPLELIIQFMINATSTSPTLSIGPQVIQVISTNGNGNGDEEGTNILQQQLSNQLQQPVQRKDDVDNKKSNAIRVLAFKVASHLKWDIEMFESHLPVTMQDSLFNDLIRFCDRNDAPDGCKLFACIWYYRWLLRCIIRSTYPSRGPKGPIIPFVLQQQIDPCYVSPESMENLIKKLQEQIEVAISDLQKVVVERNKGINVEVLMPTIDCFNNFNGQKYDWKKANKLNIIEVADDILYDLGKWFFFHENYFQANEYFEQISLLKRNRFKNLDDYITSSRELKSDFSNEMKDIEIMDFGQQIKDCIDELMSGNVCDISIFDNVYDVKEICDCLNEAFKTYSTKLQRTTLKLLTKYLTQRVRGLSNHIEKSLIFEIINEKKEKNDLKNDAEMIEDGEIITENEEVHKDPELQLIEATDPELILNLLCKVKKHPLIINSKWSLPVLHSNLLHNIPQPQYDKCHIILAKAAQLRSGNFYIESRTLYLSLLEDVQASLPRLADVIRWELVRTDLENHFDTNDKDERKLIDLVGKCTEILKRIDTNLLLVFYELTELSCVFLLESCPTVLQEFLNSQFHLIKMVSVLSILASEQSNSIRSKELWELIATSFVTTTNNKGKKNQQQVQPPTSLTPSTIISFTSKLKDTNLINILLSCLAKLHNVVCDHPSLELTIPSHHSNWWPSSIGYLGISIDASAISSLLNSLLNNCLTHRPTEIIWLNYKAELSSIQANYADALKYFTLALMISTKYFTSFSGDYSDEDTMVHKMINCCVKLGCHTQSAVLHQMTKEPNYALAFKALSERNCNDSCDDLYECIWDVTLLEYLVNLHYRRGEIERKTKAIQLIGQLEINSNNYNSVLNEAASVRRSKFMRIFARTYL